MSGVNHLDPKNYEADEVGHRIARIKLLFVERTVVAVLCSCIINRWGSETPQLRIMPVPDYQVVCLFVIHRNLISERR